MSLICAECEKVYSTQFNLNKHLVKVHKMKPKCIESNTEEKYMCATCTVYFKLNNDLRRHLEENHDFENIVDQLNFKNFEEFSDWLSQEERNNKVQYARTCGRQKRARGTEKVYYECVRSYKKPAILKEDRKRRQKSQGSCKMEKSCTSQIILTKNIETEECSVVYYKSHYLHGTDIEHLRISKLDKEIIASKLILGVSPKIILEKTRESIGEELKRTNFITGTDIRNIQRAYRINLNEGIYNKGGEDDETNSVNAWIKQWLPEENNLVIVYKSECEQSTDSNHLTSQLNSENSRDKLKEKIRSNLFQILQMLEEDTLSSHQLQLMLQHTDIMVNLGSTANQVDKNIEDQKANEPVTSSVTDRRGKAKE